MADKKHRVKFKGGTITQWPKQNMSAKETQEDASHIQH